MESALYLFMHAGNVNSARADSRARVQERIWYKNTKGAQAQYYGRSRQCGRPVGAQCSMGLGRNPLINGLIQHTFK